MSNQEKELTKEAMANFEMKMDINKAIEYCTAFIKISKRQNVNKEIIAAIETVLADNKKLNEIAQDLWVENEDLESRLEKSIEIKDGMTYGDVLKAAFPESKFEYEWMSVYMDLYGDGKVLHRFDKEWFKSKYNKPNNKDKE